MDGCFKIVCHKYDIPDRMLKYYVLNAYLYNIIYHNNMLHTINTLKPSKYKRRKHHNVLFGEARDTPLHKIKQI